MRSPPIMPNPPTTPSPSTLPAPPTTPCASTQPTSGKTRHNRGAPTAAHVVGSAAQTKPHVHIAGMELPVTAIREGNFERVDLTLLSVDEQKLPVYLRMRRMPLCDNKPWPGEPVIV